MKTRVLKEIENPRPFSIDEPSILKSLIAWRAGIIDAWTFEQTRTVFFVFGEGFVLAVNKDTLDESLPNLRS